MKLVLAIIRRERLEAVQESLRDVLDEADNYRLTVDTVEGHGAQRGEPEFFRGQPILPQLVQKTRIMIAVNDPYVERAVQAIVDGARTDGGGEVGDGKIFVIPLDDVVRIRTGERGSGAI